MEDATYCERCKRHVCELDCDFDYNFGVCYDCIDLAIELQEDQAIYEEQERYSGV